MRGLFLSDVQLHCLADPQDGEVAPSPDRLTLSGSKAARTLRIAFEIIDDTIFIVRAFYGGRNLAHFLNENAALPSGESGDGYDSAFNKND